MTPMIPIMIIIWKKEGKHIYYIGISLVNESILLHYKQFVEFSACKQKWEKQNTYDFLDLLCFSFVIAWVFLSL